MKIVLKASNIKLTPPLKKWIFDTIEPIERFLTIFEKDYYGGFWGKGKPRVEAWVEVGRATHHHHQGPVFRAECQIRLPGKSIRSEIISSDLRQAVAELRNNLQEELKGYKEKLIARTRRNQRAVKRFLKVVPGVRADKRGGRVIYEG